MTWIIPIAVALIFIAALAYWALVTTEGVFLGWRAVVWMYDLTAHKYDAIKGYDDHTEELFVVRPLLHRLRHLPAPRILDVATGTGRVPWYVLQTATFNGRVTGLDPATHMLRLAQTKLHGFGDRAPLVQQTAVPLPFAANTFDAVTCLESLEFFPSDKAALQEMVRVLKPGGILFVTRRQGRDARFFLNRYRSQAEFEAYLTRLGLTEVNSQPWQFDYDQVFGRKADGRLA